MGRVKVGEGTRLNEECRSICGGSVARVCDGAERVGGRRGRERDVETPTICRCSASGVSNGGVSEGGGSRRECERDGTTTPRCSAALEFQVLKSQGGCITQCE